MQRFVRLLSWPWLFVSPFNHAKFTHTTCTNLGSPAAAFCAALRLANNSDIFIRREGMPLFDDRLVRVKPLQAVDEYTGGVGMRGLTSFCTR